MLLRLLTLPNDDETNRGEADKQNAAADNATRRYWRVEYAIGVKSIAGIPVPPPPPLTGTVEVSENSCRAGGRSFALVDVAGANEPRMPPYCTLVPSSPGRAEAALAVTSREDLPAGDGAIRELVGGGNESVVSVSAVSSMAGTDEAAAAAFFRRSGDVSQRSRPPVCATFTALAGEATDGDGTELPAAAFALGEASPLALGLAAGRMLTLDGTGSARRVLAALGPTGGRSLALTAAGDDTPNAIGARKSGVTALTLGSVAALIAGSVALTPGGEDSDNCCCCCCCRARNSEKDSAGASVAV